MGSTSISDLKKYGYKWANLDITNANIFQKGKEEEVINTYTGAGMELSIFMIDDDATLETYAPYMNKLKGIVTNYPKKFVDKMKKD